MSPQDLDQCGTPAMYEGQLDVLRQELRSLERLYAKAIDAQATLEAQVTRLQAESTRQVEEIRALKAR